MQTSGSVEIDVPIDDVFRLTNEHVTDWSHFVIESEYVQEKAGQVGSTLRIVTEEQGKQFVFEGVITRYDPPHDSALQMMGDHFDIDVEYTFEQLGDRTRVTQISNVTGKGFFRAFLMCCGWMMRRSSCKSLERDLQNLKRYCETHATPVTS